MTARHTKLASAVASKGTMPGNSTFRVRCKIRGTYIHPVSNRILVENWVLGPQDWFKRHRFELECLKMASVGEKLGSEAESAEFAVGHQICCLARLSSPGRRGRWPPAEIRGQN